MNAITDKHSMQGAMLLLSWRLACSIPQALIENEAPGKYKMGKSNALQE
jgi:hypothetical protein